MAHGRVCQYFLQHPDVGHIASTLWTLQVYSERPVQIALGLLAACSDSDGAA